MNDLVRFMFYAIVKFIYANSDDFYFQYRRLPSMVNGDGENKMSL